MLLATARDEARDASPAFFAWARELDRKRLLTVVPVPSLQRGDVLKMAEATLGRDVSAERLASVVGLAEGNPFFVEELLRAFETGKLTSDVLPENLQEAVQARLRDVPPEALRTAEAAAVIGRAFGSELLARVTGLSRAALAREIAELNAWQVIEETEQPAVYRFRHALTQQALDAGIAANRRRELHLACAGALEGYRTTPRHSIEAAGHWAAAGDDSRAFAAFVSAAAAAERLFAFDEAATAYSAALELRPADLPATELAQILLGRAAARAALTLAEEAIADLRAAATAAVEAGDVELEAEALRLLGRQLGFARGSTEAMIHFRRAVALLPESTIGRARAQASLARMLLVTDALEESSRHAHDALEVAERHGDRALRASALGTIGRILAQTSGPELARPYLLEALVEAEAAGASEEVARAHNNYLTLLEHSGAPREEFLAGLERALAGWDGMGHAAWAMHGRAGYARTLVRAGEWERAAALLAQVEDLAGDAQLAAMRDTSGGFLAFFEGRWDDALELLKASLESAGSLGYEPRAYATAALARLRRLLGLPGYEQPVEDLLARAVEQQAMSNASFLILERVIHLAAKGDLAAAESVIPLFDEVPVQAAVPDRQYGRLVASASVAFAQARRVEAARLIDEAADWALAYDAPVNALEALTMGGAILVRQRSAAERARGYQLLDRARSLIGGKGAPFVERYLAATGSRRPRDPDAAPAIRSLTRREREVLTQLGLGKSNRQIADALVLSERTVERHTRSIYAKLGLDGRSAAIALAVRLAETAI